MQIVPIGNFGAGFECISAEFSTADVISATWLVPGGARVYVYALWTPEKLLTELFWERMCQRVQHHVRTRQLGMLSNAKGASTYADAAVTDQPATPGVIYVSSQNLEGTRREDGSYDLSLRDPAGAAAGAVGGTVHAV